MDNIFDFAEEIIQITSLVLWYWLNLNPYFEPFQTLWTWTNPVFTFGRSLYPKFFGLDLTPIINYRLLQIVEKEFDKLAHGIDEYNAYKFGITESSRLDNLPTAPSSNSYELDILSHSLDLLHNI
jgi:uncharacterized protein YggT (Ycf19 family)